MRTLAAPCGVVRFLALMAGWVRSCGAAVVLGGGLALPAQAQLNFPQLLSVSRESAATVAPGGAVSYRFATQAGTVPLASVVLLAASADGQRMRSFASRNPAVNSISVPVDATWENGSYALEMVVLTDVWGRTVGYSSRAEISSTPSAFYIGPGTHSLDFGAQGFTITGAAAQPTSAQLTELGMLSGASLAPGGVLRFRYVITPGSAPLPRLALSFRNATTSLIHTVTTDLTTATGEVSFPVGPEMANGRYVFSSALLTSSSGRALSYGNPAQQTVLQQLDGILLQVVLPYFSSTTALDFTVTGAGTTAAVPLLSVWTREGGAEVSAGSVLKFSYGTTATTPYAVRTVAMRITGPYGGFRDFSAETANGVFSVPVDQNWITGPYTVRVTVTDTVGRAAIYTTGGALTVSTGATRPSAAHSLPNEAFEFTAGGIAIPTYFLVQPAAETRVAAGAFVTLSARVAGLGATTTLSWFRGEPGDMSAPVTAGVTNAAGNFTQLQVTVPASVTYWVRATSGGAAVASVAARIVVIAPPTIAEQPVGQVASPGETATFTVTPAGDGTFTYEWRDLPLPVGQVRTERTLQVKITGEQKAGYVTCVVTNVGGSVTTQPAPLTVLASATPLHFTREAADVDYPAQMSTGGIRMEFTGNPPFRYRWQKDGKDQTAWLTMAGTSAGDVVDLNFSDSDEQKNGAYRLIVTNGFETIYSREVRVRLVRTPVIYTAPRATYAAFLGSFFSLDVAAVGLPPFTYQWRKDGVGLPGETTKELWRSNLTAADAGSYDVVVTNAGGSVTSTRSVVTVSPVSIIVPPGIAQGPSDRTARAGEDVTFTVVPTGDNRRCVWYKNGRPWQDGADTTFTLRNVGATDSGNYSVSVVSPIGGSAARSFRFAVTAAQDQPVVMRPPASATFKRGEVAQLTVAVDGKAPIRLQWRRNGVPISGATDTILYVSDFDSTRTGSYDVVATNDLGAVTSAPATLSLPAPSTAGRLMNVSVRANAGGAHGPLIVGFVVGGGTPEDMPLLVRAAGRALEPFGIADALANPVATLYTGAAPRMANDDWSGFAPVAATAARVGAFPFPVALSRDAAFGPALPAGGYTVHVTGADGTGGVALTEIYDATPAPEITEQRPRLLNLSVQTKADAATPVIVGFALGGAQPKQILVRATGPSLAAFGVQGVLADVQLALFREQTRLAENDDWAGTAALRTAFESVGAFPLASAGSKDSALVATLSPGTYTVQVRGVGAAAGLVLVEIYELP